MTKKFSLSLFILFLSIHTLNAQVTFHKEVKNGRFVLYGINIAYSPLVLNVTLDSLGIDVSKFLSEPKDTIQLFDIMTNDWTDRTDISPWIKAQAIFGSPNAKPDEFKYRLPFAKGSNFECIQSFNGNFSHNAIASKYAIDFKMPIGTPIYAARGGTVVYTKEDSNEGGRDREKYIDKANKIMIYHNDGTVASYDHLMPNGVDVKEGEMVEIGQLIGYSGNTGFSTTPHLHFVVRVLQEAVKIDFEGLKKAPRKGKRYSHY